MDFINFIKEFGFPVFCVIAGGYGVYRICLIIISDIAKPVGDRHIKFLDEMASGLALQSQAMQTMAIQMGKVVSESERMGGHLTTMIQENTKLREQIAALIKNVSGVV